MNKESCKHKKLRKLYYRKTFSKLKTQKWVVITNFLVCEECGLVFKIKEELTQKIKDGEGK